MCTFSDFLFLVLLLISLLLFRLVRYCLLFNSSTILSHIQSNDVRIFARNILKFQHRFRVGCNEHTENTLFIFRIIIVLPANNCNNFHNYNKILLPLASSQTTLIMSHPRLSHWRLLPSLYENERSSMLMCRLCLPLPRSVIPSLHLPLHKGILCYASLYKAERQEMTAKSGSR